MTILDSRRIGTRMRGRLESARMGLGSNFRELSEGRGEGCQRDGLIVVFHLSHLEFSVR